MIELSPRLELPEHIRDFHHGVSADLDTFAADIIAQSQRRLILVHNPPIVADLSLFGQTLAAIRQGSPDVRMHAVLPAADSLWFGKYSHAHNLNLLSVFDSVTGQFTPAIHSHNVAKALRDTSAPNVCFVIGRTHKARSQAVDSLGEIAKSCNQVTYPSHLSQDAMLWLAQESGFPDSDLETIRTHKNELRALRHLPLIDTYYRYNISGGDLLGRLSSNCPDGIKYCLDDLNQRLSFHLEDVAKKKLGGSSEDMRKVIRFFEGGEGEYLSLFNQSILVYGEYD